MRILAKPNLKAERMKKGFTVVELAKSINLSKQAIWQVESRKNGVSITKSQEIMKLLGVEFDDVFELEEKE